MANTIEAPADYIEELANLGFPPATQLRIQELMEKNNEGLLTDEERGDLGARVELSERLSVVRGRARTILRGLAK